MSSFELVKVKMNSSREGKISVITGTSIVIANMVGTGVFTSLGFQLVDLKNTATIIVLWGVGGIMALSGAFTYAELGTAINRSGGEYTFLSKTFNPLIGYLSGWISMTVGFAAPIALSAIAFTEYLPVKVENPRLMGLILIWSITAVHSFNLNISAKFQNISTLFKVLLIVLITGLGLILPGSAENTISFQPSFFNEITSTAFAVSLIYVSYSYAGWNAAAYITDEFKNPLKSLPTALIGGTLIVTILYTLLQFVFIKQAPYTALAGKINIGTIAVKYMLGDSYSSYFSTAISFLLISSISAMTWIGSRVTYCISEDYALWKPFRNNKDGIPLKALWLQAAISSVLILTGAFDQILVYCGILLNISVLLTVIGAFRLRQPKFFNRHNKAAIEENNNEKTAYKSPLFPLFQIIFILISLWIIGFSLVDKPIESLVGAGNLFIGFLTYMISLHK